MAWIISEMATVEAPRWETELRKFLANLFEGDELKRFVRDHYDDDAVQALPLKSTLAELAEYVVHTLQQRGLLTHRFFESAGA